VRLGVVVASIVFASKLIPTASEAYKANPDVRGNEGKHDISVGKLRT
jgi:hypothetical protein